AGAQVNGPTGIAVDTAANIYIADTNNDRVRKILASSTTFLAAPSDLTFTATSGAAETVPQQITLSSALTGLSWSATAANAPWLLLSPASGSMPAKVN